MRLLLAMGALLGLAWAGAAVAEPVRTPRAETELVVARAAIAPGDTIGFVLRQKPQPGWHTYWINPGDSGQPPSLQWTAPAGFVAGPLLHPAPRVESLGPITTYVHDAETLYPVAVKAPAALTPGQTAAITVKANWLICSDICVPESADFSFRLPVAAAGRDDPRGAALLARAVAGLPAPAGKMALDFQSADTVKVTFRAAAGADDDLSKALAAGDVRAPLYFPYNAALIDHAATAKATVSKDAVSFDIPKSISFQLDPSRGEGLLSVEIRQGDAWVRRSFMFGRPPGEGPVPAAVEAVWSGAAPPPAPAPVSAPAAGLGVLLQFVAFAFLGGLILNVMPCVLPVLSVKAFALANAHHQGEARRHGAFFLVGVMASFLALGAVLAALKAAGAAAGWGFQLQEPLVIGALALLFFAIGLNLLGMFELGGVENLGAGLAGRDGDIGAFFTGALAVVAATPCTAPFMAGALGWAATQPTAASLAVFAGLGLGFAAPFTLLSFAPALRRILPKPGPWMEKVKQALAFPMFATVVWLIYVFAAQTGPAGTAALLAAMVSAAFLVWTLRGGTAWRLAGAAVFALTLVAAVPMARAMVTEKASTAAASEAAWSSERVEALRAAGKPVFVNFTAAWCVTCKANELAAISRPAVRKAFDSAGVVTLTGDWTSRDPAIEAELAAHGRDGVPLYLFYAPGAKTPSVLPQILSEQILIDAVSGGGA